MLVKDRGKRYHHHCPVVPGDPLMTLTSAASLLTDLAAKRDRLLAVLRELEGTAVAFSGGIDSTVVAQAAFLALGAGPSPSPPTAPACRAPSSTTPGPRAGRSAFGTSSSPPTSSTTRITSATTAPAATSARANCTDASKRCCRELGVAVICSGANLDDLGDYRPGLKAAAEHRVRHPLAGGRLSPRPTCAPWPAPGACRRGTSRPRRACRAGWPPAWR